MWSPLLLLPLVRGEPLAEAKAKADQPVGMIESCARCGAAESWMERCARIFPSSFLSERVCVFATAFLTAGESFCALQAVQGKLSHPSALPSSRRYAFPLARKTWPPQKNNTKNCSVCSSLRRYT